MKVMIIHAHPEPKSFTSALKDIALKHFRDRGDTVQVKDLYAMDFNPVGIRRDFKKISDSIHFSYLKEQMVAFKTDGYTDELKIEMNDLQQADFVLLNFPLWWSSMPAILKGWWDRVAALGFAYHPKDQLYETGIFRGKKAMCCITTGGAKEAYSEGGANGDIYKVIYHINHGLLYYLGMDVLPPFFAWKAHLVDEGTLKGYLADYKKHLDNLENAKPMY